MSQFDPNALLTLAEAQAIEQTLLPAQTRFLIRVALYSLRYLLPLAQAAQIPLEQLTPSQIDQWLTQDSQIAAAEAQQPGFQAWYGQFLLASLVQLQKAAQAAEVAPEDLTLTQVIDWFAAQARQSL